MAKLIKNLADEANPTTQQSLVTFKRYVTEVPTLYECQLSNVMRGLKVKGRKWGIFLNRPTIGACTGNRGDGKSTTLSYIGIFAMAQDIPVWCNFPIKYYLIRTDGTKVLKESNPLDLNYLLTIPDDVQGGFVLIDEYQDWAPAYDFNTKRNRILYAFWGQLRKNLLSFFYTTKFLDMVDKNHRNETDIEINCEDASWTPGGQEKYDEGEIIYWHIRDFNQRMAYVPRSMYKYVPEFDFKFYAKPIWGAFDTTKRTDIFDAMSKVKLSLMEKVIGNTEPKGQGEQSNGYHDVLTEVQQQELLQMFTRKTSWSADYIYDHLGLTTATEKTGVRRFLALHEIAKYSAGNVIKFRKIEVS